MLVYNINMRLEVLLSGFQLISNIKNLNLNEKSETGDKLELKINCYFTVSAITEWQQLVATLFSPFKLFNDLS